MVLEPLALAWNGVLLAWAHDRMTIDQVDEILQRTTRLLFAGAAPGR